MNKINISENRLKNIIKESITKVLTEGQYDDSPITKWVYWCFNYPYPQEWIPQIEWDGANADHFLTKFSDAYKTAGSSGAMNKFFIELDKGNQRKLIDYVLNNY